MIVASTIAALGLGLAAVLCLMTAVWLASLARRDAGIIATRFGTRVRPPGLASPRGVACADGEKRFSSRSS